MGSVPLELLNWLSLRVALSVTEVPAAPPFSPYVSSTKAENYPGGQEQPAELQA